MEIGFSIIFDEKSSKKIIEAQNRAYDKSDILFKLGKEHKVPHITITQGEYGDNVDYKSIANELAKKTKELNKYGDLIQEKGITGTYNGWYFFDVNKTEDLQFLHDYANELIGENIGYEVKDKYDYRPHISLGKSESRKIDENIKEELEKKLSNLSENMKVQKVAVYEIGLYGTNQNCLYEVDLSRTSERSVGENEPDQVIEEVYNDNDNILESFSELQRQAEVAYKRNKEKESREKITKGIIDDEEEPWYERTLGED